MDEQTRKHKNHYFPPNKRSKIETQETVESSSQVSEPVNFLFSSENDMNEDDASEDES